MKHKTYDILGEALRLVSRPGGHTKNVLARDREGEPQSYESAKAVSFCALGAVYRAADDQGSFYSGVGPALELCARVLGGKHDDDPIVNFNNRDSTTTWDVVAMFAKARRLAAQQESQ